MIECSICHAHNDDLARFCAECGQRLGAAASAGQEEMPPLEPNNPQPSIISHTPEVPQVGSNPETPIAGAPLSSTQAKPEQANFQPEQPQSQEPSFTPPPKQTPKLRSPLLAGDEVIDEDFGLPDYQALRKGRTPFPHRTSLEHVQNPEQPPNTDESNPAKPGKPAHLRSPLLGGDFEDEEEYFPEDESDPGALRSPLLQSRVPHHDRPPRSFEPAPPPPPGEPPAGEPRFRPTPQDDMASRMSPDKIRVLKNLEKSKYGDIRTGNTQPEPPQPPMPPPVQQSMFPPPQNIPPPPPPAQEQFSPPFGKMPEMPKADTGAPNTTLPLEGPRARPRLLKDIDEMQPIQRSTNEIPVEAEHAGAVRFFIYLLYMAIVFKLWLIFDYFKAGYASPSFVCDQLGQLTAIFFLIFVGSLYSRPR